MDKPVITIIVESAEDRLKVAAAQWMFRDMGNVFGLMFGEGTDRRVGEGWKSHLSGFP